MSAGRVLGPPGAIRPVGESALLAEVPDARAALALYRRLRATAPPGVVDVVPAAATVLVTFDPALLRPASVTSWLTAAADARAAPVAEQTRLAPPAPDAHTREAEISRAGQPAPGDAPAPMAGAVVAGGQAADHIAGAAVQAGGGDAGPAAGPIVEIGVRYDGPDLAAVAVMAGLTVPEVIRAHTASLWTAAFIGFAPGFAYLVGGDERLSVPRRERPRTAVPAGSVALAAGYCGVYPAASPGGWQLIGHTEAELWNPSRAAPALVQPGTRVRFVALGTA